jgi:hypothetical protein
LSAPEYLRIGRNRRGEGGDTEGRGREEKKYKANEIQNRKEKLRW